MAMATGCDQPPSQGFSSTLQAPAKPGDGYSLLRASDSEHMVERIAVKGDYLYFTMFWHGVYAMPKYGGEVRGIDTDSSAEDSALAASATDVVWIKSHFDSHDTPNSQLRRLDSGGATTNLKQGNLGVVSLGFAKNLQVSPTQAFMLGEGFVEATPLAGGASSRVPFAWDENFGGEASFQADDRGLYLTDCPITALCPGQDCGGNAGTCTLSQGDFATGQATVLESLPGRATAVAIDDQALYLQEPTRLWRRSRLDGTEVDLFVPDPLVGALSAPVAADADHLYLVSYAAPGNGPFSLTLLAVPKAGGAPAIIGTDARLASGVWDLAVDDQFVFALIASSQGESGNEVLAFPKTATPVP